MSRQLLCVALAAGFVGAPISRPVSAQPVEVCKLLPKEEVKKHLPWNDALDAMPIEELPIATGSTCEYPSVGVQVLQFSQRFIDTLRESGPLETLSGLGGEAYFRHNPNGYAEVFVRVGARLLTLQASEDGNVATVKPKVIDLAKVYVSKLR